MTKVMVFGTFDILHPGHVAMLNEAKKLGDRLVVVVALDNTVLEVKKKAPKNSEEIRIKNLEKLKIADKVILGDATDKNTPIRKELPDIIAIGYDQISFVEEMKNEFGQKIRIYKLTPYKTDIYKSSLLE